MTVLVHRTSLQLAVSQALPLSWWQVLDSASCLLTPMFTSCSGGSDHVQQQLHSHEAADIQCLQ